MELSQGLVKKYRGGGGGGGPEHLEMWLIKIKHGPPPPFGTKMTDPPLKQGWKLHDPPLSKNMDVWFPLNNPIKPCSLFDKIC